jgi:hypothetical protein
MSNRIFFVSCRRLAPLAAFFLFAGLAPATAQQEEPTALQYFLGKLGLLEIPDDPIEYRERAPLVVPPSNALIQPHSPDDVRGINPDWPVDQDDPRRRKKDAEAVRKSDEQFYSGRALRPDELRARTKTKPERTGMTAGEELAAGRETYRPDQLGFKGWGKASDKPVIFSGEPERRTLTDPPPGYLTPSPNAPYGVVEKKGPDFKPTTLYDRVASPDDPGKRER